MTKLFPVKYFCLEATLGLKPALGKSLEILLLGSLFGFKTLSLFEPVRINVVRKMSLKSMSYKNILLLLLKTLLV